MLEHHSTLFGIPEFEGLVVDHAYSVGKSMFLCIEGSTALVHAWYALTYEMTLKHGSLEGGFTSFQEFQTKVLLGIGTTNHEGNVFRGKKH